MKYFIDPDIISREAFRKLSSSLKALYWYTWAKADPAGVYVLDLDYLRTDNKGERYTEKDLEKLQPVGLVKIAPGKFLFVDFIEVNYVQLKPNYNPHKPAFRSLDKNNLKLDPSFTKALIKLVGKEEDVDKEEDKEGGEGGEKPAEKKAGPAIPDEVEFLAHCKDELGDKYPALEFSLKAKYKDWKANGWKDGHGNPIKIWKTKIMNTVPYLKPMGQPDDAKKVTVNQDLNGKKSGIITV